jgi:trimeric autotransporter adhesin
VRTQLRLSVVVLAVLVLCATSVLTFAQSSNATINTVVPSLVDFTGAARDAAGKPLAGVVGITFSLYREESGGSALWIETLNVHADPAGHYKVSLGAEKPLSKDLFGAGEARWLGVQISGQSEQTRVLLVSVPYALKAQDAETLGGMPASAFLKATTGSDGSAKGTDKPQALPPTVHGNGTIGYVPLWTAKNIIDKSSLFQSGVNVGVGTTTPAALFDLNGTGNIRNTLTLFPNGAANTLAISGTAFNIDHTGIITFATGQTFPGKGGTGTVTSVGLAAPTSDFTVSGSPVTSAGTLSFAWNQAPTASSIANAIVKRDSSGNFSTNSVTALSSVVTPLVTTNAVSTLTLSAATTNPVAVSGVSSASNATAISGHATSTGSGTAYGVLGGADGPFGVGVWGYSNGNAGYGVQGKGVQNGVFGWSVANSAQWNVMGNVGVQGDTAVSNGTGILGTADTGHGGWFINNDTGISTTLVVQNLSGSGWLMEADNATKGLMALDGAGNFEIAGAISKAGGSFKIDHPLDPANKYLYHSFVESPDMMNIYNGVVTLDPKGRASVALPDWFEALNRDFRYQLTAIGAPGPNLYIAEEVSGNRFKIAGGKPGAKVSWQITGVRHDAWAEAHRIPLEVEKKGAEQGHYLHPEEFGKDPKEYGIPGPAIARKTRSRQ